MPARATTQCPRTTNYAPSANVETLVLQGHHELKGYGGNRANTIFGNAGNNIINGTAGAEQCRAGPATIPILSTMR